MSEKNKNQMNTDDTDDYYVSGDTQKTPVVTSEQKRRQQSGQNGGKAPNKNKSSAKKDTRKSDSREQPAKKKKKKDEVGDEIEYESRSIIYSITVSTVYIVVVAIISLAASFFIISIGNDVFALEKTEYTSEVTLGMSPTVIDVSDALAEEGIIKYPAIFRLYARLKLDEGEEFVPGKYTVSSLQNYDSLINAFLPQSDARVTITLTIPEGYTVDEIIQLFVKNGMGTKDGFIDAIQNASYDYEFILLLDEKPLPEGRRYRLEGYLFPDTYEFYTDWSEERIIDTILNQGLNSKLTKSYYEFLKTSPYTLDEYLTIASMVEREAYYNTDMEFISGVFHNRLKNPTQYPRLESDATVLYAIGEHKTELTSADLNYDSPYNTYVHEGLPPSAICNPGWNAITTAFTPNTEDGYYYFVSRKNGETLYAKTLKEHQANVAEVKAEN